MSASTVDVVADYNAAPTKLLPIVVEHGRSGQPPTRQLRMARWGLVPSWAKDPSIGNRMINARAETVAQKPAYKRAFAKRRAIVPADGYYEWYAATEPSGKKRKQPFYISPKDGGILSMAGLYEWWRSPDGEEWLLSFTIMTTSAEDSLGHVHDRMPLMVGDESVARWLEPHPLDGGDLNELLIPAAPGRLDARPVSTEVNNVRNNGPELIEPLGLAETPAAVGQQPKAQ